jgi:2-(1,2-epoxy-1,2-dihydrophenyl)acetyl-CoA isomerase
MAEPSVLFSLSNGIARITLNRPDRRNSLDAGMKQALTESLAAVSQNDDVRALLVTGIGTAFCAGQDLAERRRAPGEAAPDLARSVREYWSPLVSTLTALPFPVVCAVNGTAAGAGMNLALSCDIVLAARSARFIESFARIGLVPDCGGTYWLPRLAGMARGMALAMLASPITAEQAERWGLIWQCVDDEQLQPEAETLVQHLAQQPTRGLALIKRAIRASVDHSLPEQLAMESDLQGIAGATADYREGIEAFFDKRPARFRGR